MLETAQPDTAGDDDGAELEQDRPADGAGAANADGGAETQRSRTPQVDGAADSVSWTLSDESPDVQEFSKKMCRLYKLRDELEEENRRRRAERC